MVHVIVERVWKRRRAENCEITWYSLTITAKLYYFTVYGPASVVRKRVERRVCPAYFRVRLGDNGVRWDGSSLISKQWDDGDLTAPINRRGPREGTVQTAHRIRLLSVYVYVFFFFFFSISYNTIIYCVKCCLPAGRVSSRRNKQTRTHEKIIYYIAVLVVKLR